MGTQASDSEMEILKIIWDAGGESLFSDIMARLSTKGFDWKKNTVLTFLARLMEKQMLRTEKKGRKNLYIALMTETEYMDMQTEDFVGKVYEGDAKGLVAALLKKDMISDKDMQEIKDFWEQGNEKNE